MSQRTAIMAKSNRCSECNAEFADAHSLAAHAAVTHLNWQPYACALGCEDFIAPTRRLLVEHCAAKHDDRLPAYRYVVDAAKERHWSDIIRRSLKTVTPQSEGMALETDVQGGGGVEEVAVQPDAHPPRRPPRKAVARPRTVSASNPQAKAASRRRSVTVRCSECGANCSWENLMPHVTRYHVDGFVFRCSACDYSSKWRSSVEKHFLRASSHCRAQVVSNADELLPAVRAAFVQCFGEAAAEQSSALRQYEQEGEVEKSMGASVVADSGELTAPTPAAVAPFARRLRARVIAAQRQRRKAAAVPKEQRASSAGDGARRVKPVVAAAAKASRRTRFKCRLCDGRVRPGGKLRHVTDYHVESFVYHCSDCDNTAKRRITLSYHISRQRKKGSHKRAKVLSNRDQLEAAVRAAYAKCFGTAAVRRSRVLRSKVKTLAVSSDTRGALQSAAADESATDENAGENDEATESVKGNEAAAAAADESAGESGADEPGPSTSAVVYRVLPKLIPIGCRCGRKGCMDIEWVVPPLKHKPFPLLIKQEELDADV